MRIGIVGTGDVAVGNYLPFLSNEANVKLGLYNRNQEKAKAAAANFDATAFSALETLADWRPDTVLVLTNETTRYEVVLELLRLGLPRMLCEKPLVAALGQARVSEADFERGREILNLAKEKNCEMAMMFNYRFFDQTLLAKRIAAERNFGDVVHVSAQVHYACWSHCIDLVRHFAGDFEEITALAGKVSREGQGIVAQDITAAFRMENGATGTLLGTAGMKWQYPLYEMFITYEVGRIHMRDIDGEIEVLDGRKAMHERIAFSRDSSRWNSYGSSFVKALTAYQQSIKDGAPPPASGMDGLKELQTEAAIKRSIETGRSVAVTSEFPIT